MPIARYQPQVNQVNLPNPVQKDIGTFIAPELANAKLGQAINDVGGTFVDKRTEDLKKDNRILGLKMSNEISNVASKAFSDFQSDVSNQGLGAKDFASRANIVTDNAVKKYMEENRVNDLPNSAKDIIDLHYLTVKSNVIEASQKFEAVQLVEGRKQVAKSYEDSALKSVAENPSPLNIEIQCELTETAYRSSMSKEEADASMITLFQNIDISAIGGMIVRKEFNGAQKILESSNLNPDKKIALEDKINRGAFELTSDGMTTFINSRLNQPSELAAVKGFDFDKMEGGNLLTPKQKSDIIRYGQNLWADMQPKKASQEDTQKYLIRENYDKILGYEAIINSPKATPAQKAEAIQAKGRLLLNVGSENVGAMTGLETASKNFKEYTEEIKIGNYWRDVADGKARENDAYNYGISPAGVKSIQTTWNGNAGDLGIDAKTLKNSYLKKYGAGTVGAAMWDNFNQEVFDEFRKQAPDANGKRPKSYLEIGQAKLVSYEKLFGEDIEEFTVTEKPGRTKERVNELQDKRQKIEIKKEKERADLQQPATYKNTKIEKGYFEKLSKVVREKKESRGYGNIVTIDDVKKYISANPGWRKEIGEISPAERYQEGILESNG